MCGCGEGLGRGRGQKRSTDASVVLDAVCDDGVEGEGVLLVVHAGRELGKGVMSWDVVVCLSKLRNGKQCKQGPFAA